MAPTWIASEIVTPANSSLFRRRLILNTEVSSLRQLNTCTAWNSTNAVSVTVRATARSSSAIRHCQ